MAPVENRVFLGDALEVAAVLLGRGLGGSADLVYIDPPFASQTDYVHEARLDGPADGRVRRSLAYVDSWRDARPPRSDPATQPARFARATQPARFARGGRGGVGAYLDMLAPRLEAAKDLLAPSGTLWVHLDWRAAYLVRVVLDEIFGREGFINEIVWRRAPNLGRQAASAQFGRTIDTILVYGGPEARISPPTRLEPIEERAIRWDDEGRPFTTAPRGDYTDASIARLSREGRVHRTASGRVYIKYFLVKDEGGRLCRERRVDTLWTDVPPLRHAAVHERTGFPTQKPRALLDRIVRCASRPGGLVVDLFAGSGTTGEAALALGRRFVLSDRGHVALATARARLLRAGASFFLEHCAGRTFPTAPAPHLKIRRAGLAEAIVELQAPVEPLAWAIDESYDARGPFVCCWHSERQPGMKPVPAARAATVARGKGPLAVRVYTDEGQVATEVTAGCTR